jgi:hypothetical protein
MPVKAHSGWLPRLTTICIWNCRPFGSSTHNGEASAAAASSCCNKEAAGAALLLVCCCCLPVAPRAVIGSCRALERGFIVLNAVFGLAISKPGTWLQLNAMLLSETAVPWCGQQLSSLRSQEHLKCSKAFICKLRSVSGTVCVEQQQHLMSIDCDVFTP